MERATTDVAGIGMCTSASLTPVLQEASICVLRLANMFGDAFADENGEVWQAVDAFADENGEVWQAVEKFLGTELDRQTGAPGTGVGGKGLLWMKVL